jgi:hypothetical protein
VLRFLEAYQGLRLFPVSSEATPSLARPGGNFTGLFLDLPELSGKQIENSAT